jgi:autophagy-related protein 17
MASPSPKLPLRSPGSSAAASRHSTTRPPDGSIPVETLVEYLLEAKRALSSMALVFDAQELADSARVAHEEAVLLRAETDFLHRGVAAQVAVLHRFREGLARTHNAGRREMRNISRRLEGAYARLDTVLESLRGETVAAGFRPVGEEPRSLMDFIDETDLDKLRGTIKASIDDLQV